MSSVTYIDKNKNAPDGSVAKIFRDVDANELKSVVNAKQDASVGKGLSTEDYTTVDKAKVDNLPGNVSQSLNDLSTSVSVLTQRWRGVYTTLAALQAAYPTANAGDTAQVDAGVSVPTKGYNYDLQEGWVETGGTGNVNSVNGQVGVVVITKTSVGLPNVPNLDTSITTNITDVATKRFVTDTEKATWNGKQTTITSIIWGAIIAAFTSKTTPIDADILSMGDSADAGNSKKVTWANIKATLKTYFDGIYTTAAAVASLGYITNVITALGYTPLNKANDTITGDIGNTSTGFFRIPSGTTAQRPATPLDGMRRYNTTTLRDEFYANGTWQNHSRLSGDTFTGAISATGIGAGIASNVAAFLNIAVNTASVGQLLLPKSAVDYTGTLAGMIWNNAMEFKFYDDVLVAVNRFIKLNGNIIFANSNALNVVTSTGTGGNLGTLKAETAFSRYPTAVSYTVLLTDVGFGWVVAVTSTAAARTITLPLANSVAANYQLTIKDESNAAGTNNITIALNGSDTTDVTAINSNGGFRRIYSDGVSKWFST